MTLTCAETRELDRRAIQEYGIPGMVLMENAGRAMAELIIALGVHGPVAVCCGKGNNGGDGFVIARYLDGWRVPVRVLLFCQPADLTGDAAANCHIVQQCDIPLSILAEPLDNDVLRQELARAEWAVDALFGSG